MFSFIWEDWNKSKRKMGKRKEKGEKLNYNILKCSGQKKIVVKNCVVFNNFKSCLVVSKIFSSFFFKQLEMRIKMSFWFGQWSKCRSITVDRSLSICIELRYESTANIEEPSCYDHAPPYSPPGQLMKQQCHFYMDLFEFK